MCPQENIEPKNQESEQALARYRRLRLSSPAIWQAAHRRASFVGAALKKGRKPLESLLAYLRLLVHESKQSSSHNEPSLRDVEDAICAKFPEEQERKRALTFHRALVTAHKLFRASRFHKKSR